MFEKVLWQIGQINWKDGLQSRERHKVILSIIIFQPTCERETRTETAADLHVHYLKQSF